MSTSYFSVTDFGADPEDTTDDTAAIEAAIAAAATSRRAVFFPSQSSDSVGYVVSDRIVVPDGVELIVAGRVVGTTTAHGFAMGSSALRCIGEGRFHDANLILTHGSPRVYNFRYSGHIHLAAILIESATSSSYSGLVIDGIDVRDASYGIVQQGSNTTITGGLILNGYFQNLIGDAIELNQTPLNHNVVIDNHLIEGIDSGTGATRPNWGIGVGIAGIGYYLDWPTDKTTKSVTISRIRGRSLRQLIHLENAEGVEVYDVEGDDISESYSAGAGLDCATVVVYGSKNVSIRGVRNRNSHKNAGIKIWGGATSSVYQNLSTNIDLSDICLSDGSVELEVGRSENDSGVELYSYAAASDIDLRNGRFELRGRCDDMRLTDISARRLRTDGAAFMIDNVMADARDNFRSLAGRARLKVMNCEGLDEYGAASASIDIAGVGWIEGSHNNFALAGNQTTNRTITGNGAGGLPFGREFVAGDVAIDTGGPGRYLVTTGGSRNRASDTFAVADSSTIYSTSLAWTDPDHHYPGQKITLPGCGPAGANLQTSVVRVYLDGGASQYRMVVSDTISAAPGTTGTLAAANTPVTVTI